MYIDHVFGASRIVIRLSALGHPILIFFTVDTLVNSLTGQAIGLPAHGTTEDVDIVIAHHSPSSAIGRLAVDGPFLHRFLRQSDGTGQMPFKHLRVDQLQKKIIGNTIGALN